jgi:hypothetical protein
MSSHKFKLETTLDKQKSKEAILKALKNNGYKVVEESDAKIVAKQQFSGTYYPHEVEVLLDSKPGETGISAFINHRGG